MKSFGGRRRGIISKGMEDIKRQQMEEVPKDISLSVQRVKKEVKDGNIMLELCLPGMALPL